MVILRMHLFGEKIWHFFFFCEKLSKNDKRNLLLDKRVTHEKFTPPKNWVWFLVLSREAYYLLFLSCGLWGRCPTVARSFHVLA